MKRARTILGQLVQGQLAEKAFERIYKETMGTDALHLEDAREARTETDYRVLNGSNRPVFRINIKFHGTLFRNAQDQVGLNPEDCFALATYKIHQGLLKQDREVLPYILVIVSAPGLTAEAVGAAISTELIHFVSLVHAGKKFTGKRAIEERVVDHLLRTSASAPFHASLQGYRQQIEKAEWRVLFARKADQLLRKLLFDRVYAVRVPRFARNYRNAELDMHFSLQSDLTPLRSFLDLLKTQGLHGLTAYLERGLV